jgi:hypothetical protein
MRGYLGIFSEYKSTGLYLSFSGSGVKLKVNFLGGN